MIRHPPLPAGIASAAWAGDEFNGGGVQDVFAPEIIFSGEVFKPALLASEFFVDIDIRIGGECREVRVPHERREMCVKEAA